MKKIVDFVRCYPFSVICMILIWALSLTPFFPETPLDNVAFIDKWTHFAMYGGTTAVMWIEYLRSHDHLNAKVLYGWVLIGMVLLGGIIELLQKYATTTRSGEWLDFLADGVGVLLGTMVGMLFNRYFFHIR